MTEYGDGFRSKDCGCREGRERNCLELECRRRPKSATEDYATMPAQSAPNPDYELAEQENDNLRRLLRWSAERLSATDRDTLEAMIAAPIDDSGIVPDVAEHDIEEKIREVGLFDEVADHLVPLLERSPRLPKGWYNQLDALIQRCREAGPKNPVAMRYKNEPAVFRAIRRVP